MKNILYALRHLLAILLLPFVVIVVVPTWLRSAEARFDTQWSGAALAAVARGCGTLVFLAGFALFVWCVLLFARVGKGTLAPWDPTQRLVVVGPYRHVRNPMISSVVSMLLGESLVLGSRVVLFWTVFFAVVNHAYFVLLEEPGLERRFGADYRKFKASVPRWVPRATPWTGA